MTLPAILCLIASGGIIFGGLVWSLLRLRKYPDISEMENAEDQ